MSTLPEHVLIAREKLELSAQDLKDKISRGEKIPLDQLRAFITFVNNDCKDIKAEKRAEAKAKGAGMSADQVDFF